jgi:hypothetical protein
MKRRNKSWAFRKETAALLYFFYFRSTRLGTRQETNTPMTNGQITKQQNNTGFSFPDPAWTNVSCSKQWSDMGIWDGCHQRKERKEESAVSTRSVSSSRGHFFLQSPKAGSIISDFLHSDWLIFDFFYFCMAKSRRKKEGADRGWHGWMDAWPHLPMCDSYPCLSKLCVEMIQ